MVRPDDAGAERSDGRAPAPRGRLLLPLVVAAAVVVVLSTALAGRPTFTPPQLGGNGSVVEAPGAPPSARPTRSVSVQPPAVPDSVVPTILQVLVAAIAVVVAVVLIRLLVAALRGRGRRSGLRALGGAEAAAGQEVADAPTVLRGIAAALLALGEDRAPGDAVVRAWLGLQQAAEDAGFARSPAETPTEFTGRVLTRTGADRTALDTLLRLYLHARFGGDAISALDADAAREALHALEASWERVAAEEPRA